jgi:thermitase
MINKFLLLLFFCVVLPINIISLEYAPAEILIQTSKELDLDKKIIGFISTRESDQIKILNTKYKYKTIQKLNPQASHSKSYIRGASINDKSADLFMYKLSLKTTPNNLIEVIKELEKSPEIKNAQPNYKYKFHTAPNDTYYNEQWALPLLNMKKAWQLTTGKPEVIIAVIDSGVNYEHDDLKDNIWQNENEIENSLDDDGNGYIDDLIGWDFFGDYSFGQTSPDNDPMDETGHGTHVAGIIAAQINNNLGIVGVAPNCKIMCLRAGNDNMIFTSDIASGIYYATNNGAKIINLSLGKSSTDFFLKSSILFAVKNNVLVIASSGNDSLDLDVYTYVPAQYDEVLTVGAIKKDNILADYSNYGSCIDLVAPGGADEEVSTENDILSTYLEQSYGYGSGTSMAAPHVAGVAALLATAFPSATSKDLKQALQDSATDLGATGKDTLYGYGKPAPYNAILTLDSTTPRLNHSRNQYIELDKPFTIDASIVDNISLDEWPKLSLFYRYFKSTNPTPNWQQTEMSKNKNNFSASFAATSDIQEFQYYFHFDDIKQAHSRYFPADYENDYYVLYLGEQQQARTMEFELFGTNGSGSPIINSPNPFNPKNETTSICFEVNQFANITVYIYSLNLQLVYKTDFYTIGYHEEIWDGRDQDGDVIPNGIYILIVKAEYNGKSIIKRNKIAVLLD